MIVTSLILDYEIHTIYLLLELMRNLSTISICWNRIDTLLIIQRMISIWFFNTFKIIWVMQLARFQLFFRVLVDYLILNIWSRLCLKGQKVMMKILNICVDKQKWSRQHQLYEVHLFIFSKLGFTELTTLVWSTPGTYNKARERFDIQNQICLGRYEDYSGFYSIISFI